MCKFFEVSRSGYYKYVKNLNQPEKNVKIVEKICQAQKRCNNTYGYRRMKVWLDSDGVTRNSIVPIIDRSLLLNHSPNEWFSVYKNPRGVSPGRGVRKNYLRVRPLLLVLSVETEIFQVQYARR